MNERMLRKFLKVLREEQGLLREDEEVVCRSTYRTDKLGNRVSIPYGGSYAEGKNGRGVGVPKGCTAQEDNVGQQHVIPPGKVLRVGKNGKGVVICPGQSTSEKNGQIVVNQKKLKKESRKLSCLELLRGLRFLDNG